MTIAPSTSIELSTGIGEVGESFLTLDDPIKGELDNADYPLFDPVGPDIITDIAVGAFEYAIRRGRNDELDTPSAGTCGISLRNHDATYQFDGTDGYDAGRRIRVLLDGIIVFDGIASDWVYEYPVGGGSTARIIAADALSMLANQTFNEWTASAQTPGERFSDALDRPEVAFPDALRTVDTSSTVDYAAEVVAWGSNVLSYLHSVARSDTSLVFVSRDGQLTFQRRRNVTFTIDATFSDDGTGIPMSAIQPISGSEFYYTRISGKRTDGTEQSVSLTGAPVTRTLTLPDLLLASDDDVLYLLEQYLDTYQSPRTRIRSMSVNLSKLTSDQRAEVLALDIGDVASVTWTPEGAALPVEFTGYIEAISIEGSYNSTATMRFELSPANYHPLPAFTLDDADYGELDDDVLYF